MDVQIKLSTTEVEDMVAKAIREQFPKHKADVSISAYGSTIVELSPEKSDAADGPCYSNLEARGGRYILVLTSDAYEIRLTMAVNVVFEEAQKAAAALAAAAVSVTLRS